MPDRIIRDELLTSERYWSVGIDAQRLFVHLLLSADALGRFSGKNYTIRAACYPGHAPDAKLIEKFLTDLHDADLIRIYEVNGERYVFIPRYRQRLRAKDSYLPAPPKGINDIPEEKSDSSQTQVRLKSDLSRPKEGSEVKGSEVIQELAADAAKSVWDFGVTLLGEQGIKEKSARAFMASLMRQWDLTVVESALRSATGKVEVKSYVLGCLKEKPKKGQQKRVVI